MIIVFCDNLIDRKVDPDFEAEFSAARAQGFQPELISFEELLTGNIDRALARVKTKDQPEAALYRGWMLTPKNYALLYKGLQQRNITLLNDADAYKTCHYFPNTYPFIEGHTPESAWMAVEEGFSVDDVFKITERFGNSPIIVKDFVKSQKHYWAEACFIPDASDAVAVRKITSRFLELQGEALNEGLVFRKFEALEFLTSHSKSNMPLTKEFRLFFFDGKLVGSFHYWSEGDYGDVTPVLDIFLDIAKNVTSKFFTMDIAKKKDGDWTIMELGDGQVSGLPDTADVGAFYAALKNLL